VFRPLQGPRSPAPGPVRHRLTPRFLRPAPAAATASPPRPQTPRFPRLAAAIEATGEPGEQTIERATPEEPRADRGRRRARGLACVGLAGVAAVVLASLLGFSLGNDPAPITGPTALAGGIASATPGAGQAAGGAGALRAGPLLTAFRLPAPELFGGATSYGAHTAPPDPALPRAGAEQVGAAVALQPLRFGAPGPGLASGSKLASVAGMALRGLARPVVDDRNPLYELGYRLQRKGETASAIAAYELAAETDPGHAATFYNWGYLLQQQGDEAAARARYRRALELAPQHAFAHYNLAWLLQRAGEDAAAIEHYRAAIAAEPRFAWSHYNLGWLEHKRGHLRQALAGYRRSIDLDPRLPLAHENIAAILRQQR